MKRIRWIEQDSMVSSFPVYMISDHYKAFLKAKGEDSRPVDNLSDKELIEYAKQHMNRKDVAQLNFRCGSVGDHTWPESWRPVVYQDSETAFKNSPFVSYDDPSWR